MAELPEERREVMTAARELIRRNLRRPALWESTAIPDIRQQAAELAKLLL